MNFRKLSTIKKLKLYLPTCISASSLNRSSFLCWSPWIFSLSSLLLSLNILSVSPGIWKWKNVHTYKCNPKNTRAIKNSRQVSSPKQIWNLRWAPRSTLLSFKIQSPYNTYWNTSYFLIGKPHPIISRFKSDLHTLHRQAFLVGEPPDGVF